jgi:hypothetical protein
MNENLEFRDQKNRKTMENDWNNGENERNPRLYGSKIIKNLDISG